MPSFEVIGQTVRLRMAGTPSPGGLSAFPISAEGGATVSTTGRDLSSTVLQDGGNDITAQSQAERAKERDRPSDCVPAMFLDGVSFEPVGGELGAIRPGDVEGIEIYARSALAPTEFRRGRTDCGIILIWLREGNGK